MSAMTCGSVGYSGRPQRGYSSSGKLVDVTLNEETGEKLFELIGTCLSTTTKTE
jgi:hypothetical protein